MALIFSWDHGKSQEKMKTMFTQNFGGTNKEYYSIFESGPFQKLLLGRTANVNYRTAIARQKRNVGINM